MSKKPIIIIILLIAFLSATLLILISSEKKERESEKQNLECTDFYCFEKHYQNLVEKQNITAAFSDLKMQYEKDNSLVKNYCHLLTHVIGRAAVKKYPDLIEAYRQGDHFCWSGYYHGVMEGNLYKTKTEELPKVINEICQKIPGRENYSFDYYNCVHGLGHGVMYVTKNELFKALKLCDYLDGAWERESCYGGVFMENVIADFENHFTDYLRPDEPMYPCPAVPEKNKHACYLMQTSFVLKNNGYDFADAFSECRKVEERYKRTCFQSLGRDASGQTVSDIKNTKDICLIGENSGEQLYCIIGAARDFVSYFHSDNQAKELCTTFDSDISDICLREVENYYRSF